MAEEEGGDLSDKIVLFKVNYFAAFRWDGTIRGCVEEPKKNRHFVTFSCANKTNHTCTYCMCIVPIFFS